jgi:hypothetical protein
VIVLLRIIVHITITIIVGALFLAAATMVTMLPISALNLLLEYTPVDFRVSFSDVYWVFALVAIVRYALEMLRSERISAGTVSENQRQRFFSVKGTMIERLIRETSIIGGQQISNDAVLLYRSAPRWRDRDEITVRQTFTGDQILIPSAYEQYLKHHVQYDRVPESVKKNLYLLLVNMTLRIRHGVGIPEYISTTAMALFDRMEERMSYLLENYGQERPSLIRRLVVFILRIDDVVIGFFRRSVFPSLLGLVDSHLKSAQLKIVDQDTQTLFRSVSDAGRFYQALQFELQALSQSKMLRRAKVRQTVRRAIAAFRRKASFLDVYQVRGVLNRPLMGLLLVLSLGFLGFLSLAYLGLAPSMIPEAISSAIAPAVISLGSLPDAIMIWADQIFSASADEPTRVLGSAAQLWESHLGFVSGGLSGIPRWVLVLITIAGDLVLIILAAFILTLFVKRVIPGLYRSLSRAVIYRPLAQGYGDQVNRDSTTDLDGFFLPAFMADDLALVYRLISVGANPMTAYREFQTAKSGSGLDRIQFVMELIIGSHASHDPSGTVHS